MRGAVGVQRVGRMGAQSAAKGINSMSASRRASLRPARHSACTCLVSSAFAAVMLFTPSSGFMASPTSTPTGSNRVAADIRQMPSAFNLGGLGSIVRGATCRAGRLCSGSLSFKSTAVASTHTAASSSVPSSPGDELLARHPKLVTGALPNGFRYCIFQNSKPASRFYANLEVHAGSVDETDQERGIAHYLEHMVFLGTEKHETNDDMKKLFTKLGMAFNADANAYTDFRSTVYTLSAPTRGRAKHIEEGGGAALFGGHGPMSTAAAPVAAVEEEDGGDINGVADDSDNVELVLDLLHQMVFRARIEQKSVDSERGAILSELRDRNSISNRVAMDYYRFIHGDTRLPERFPIGLEEQVKAFSSEQVKAFYDKHYNAGNMCLYIAGDINPAEVETAIMNTFGKEGVRRGALPTGAPPSGPEACLWQPRGQLIVHKTVEEGIPPGSGGRLHVTSHDQINDFSLSFNLKEPFTSTRTVAELRESLCDTIVGLALDLRMRSLRLADSEPKFQGISWSYTASAREGCSQNSLSVSALPKFWREAVSIAGTEAKRLEMYGVTEGELSQARTALINGLVQQASMKDSQTSSSWLSKVMSAVQDGDQLMDPEDKRRTVSGLLEEVTLEEINARAAVLFKPITEFADPALSRSVAFVSHPVEWEGSEPFSEEEMKQLLRASVVDVLPPASSFVPDELLPHSKVMSIASDVKPTITSKDYDPETGITRGRLSNGFRFNHRKNDARPNEVSVRAVALGGRALEDEEAAGSVIAGLACWLNGGVAGYDAETISRFMTMHNLQHDAACHTDELTFDMKVATTVPGALRRGLGFLRLLLTEPDFDQRALERFKQRAVRADKSLHKSIERSTAAKFFENIMTPDNAWKLKELQPSKIAQLTPEDVRSLILQQWTPHNVELSISGDFAAAELEEELVNYLGTIPPAPEGQKRPWEGDAEKGFEMKLSGKQGYEDVTRVNDDEVRVFAVMGFPTINRWGQLETGGLSIDASDLRCPPTLKDGSQYDSKMHANRCLAVASEMMQNVLFDEIRTKRGLVYGISFALKPYKHTPCGIASISFMPKDENLDESVEAVKAVLRRIVAEGFTEADLKGVKDPLVTKARESEITNGLWLMLMEDLQSETNPKDLLSVRRVADHYDTIELDHVNEAVKRCWGHCVDKLWVQVGKSGPGLVKNDEES